MNLLKNLKIGRRLALGFALTIGAALAIASVREWRCRMSKPSWVC